MHYRYIPQIWPLILSGIVTIFLGIFVLSSRRESKGASVFGLSMFVVTLWSLPNALELMATNLPTKIFWANLQYIAYCYSPVTLLAICMEFTGYDKWIRNKKILWLALLPTVIIFLVWTNEYHGLIRYDIHLRNNGLFYVIAKKYGIAFYVHALYSHLLNISAIVLLIKSLFQRKSVYRKQVIVLFAAASMIIVPNLVYISGLSPLKYDITPIFFGPAGIITMWAIFRYKLFALMPLARATVMETINAGVMVLDSDDRVIDVNPAFLNIVDRNEGKYQDMSAEEICRNVPEFIDACKERSKTQQELSVHSNQSAKFYEVLQTPLMDKKRKVIGRLVVFYEITEKKQAQQEFLKQQWTQAGIEEKERLARDLHDNLGQLLGFINLQAQGIRQELRNCGVDMVSEKLDQLIEVTQMAHTEIRDYISNIRSSVHSEQDFISSFKKQIEQFKNQTGLNMNFDIPSDLSVEKLKPVIWMNLLYIIKEALNNIRKHAGAENVTISLQITEKILFLSVEDDGKGFNTNLHTYSNKTGFGIDIMHERSSEIGGEISIRSVIGKGTKVILCVPLEEGENKDANETDAGR